MTPLDKSEQSFHVEAMKPGFAAVSRGVDLRRPLGAALVQKVVKAIDDYAVLVFRDQFLTNEELVAVGEQFGPLDRGLQQKLLHKIQTRIGNDAISDVSNLDASGKIGARDDTQVIMTVGNRFWHTDSSYDTHPFRYSILNAVTAASWGGQTEFADLRAAYDDLDQRTKDLISDKIAVFYSHFTRQRMGIEDTKDALSAYPPVRWPMVRTHAGSGRKVVWCCSKVCEIEGMTVPEGRALAHDLIEHIGQREHVYSHAWRAGDVVFYDNRAVLHRGRTFDLSERREMRRVATVDVDSTCLGVAKPRAGFWSGPPLDE
jgi:alpha-ketoglutarate-dependent 2,4-dichlorophenoxyacetate dioxygenase